MTNTEKRTTKVITPTCTLSFPHLDKAVQAKNDDGTPQGKPKFSAAFIFAPGTDRRALEAAADAAGFNRWGDKYAEVKKKFRFKAIRDDVEEKGYPDGSVFINARTETPPGLVYSHADPETKKPARVAADDIVKVFYPGAQVRASLNAFAYDRNGNKGVAFGLNNIQFVGDGPRLDSRKAAEDEFVVDLSAEPASLEDLTA